MLNHEKIVNSDPEIKFDNITPQMRKPIYLDAIDAWMGNLPREVDTNIKNYVYALPTLGYEYKIKRKNGYGKADKEVVEKVHKSTYVREWTNNGELVGRHSEG